MPALNWLGKEIVEISARRTPVLSLEPRKAASGALADPSRGNLLIQGDNLAGLKALSPYFTEAFKLVYMDPPYNTGNSTWIYNDNVDSAQIRNWLHKEVGPEDLARSDKWLCMMLPRLQLALELLRPDDGVLVVSIDDAEVAHLTMLLDSLLGPANHVATICWRTRPANNKANHVGVIHEYLLIYAKNYGELRSLDKRWRINKPGVDEVLAWADELLADRSLSDARRAEQIRGRHNRKQKEIADELLRDDPQLGKEEVDKQVKKRWDALRRYNRFDRRGLFRPDNLSWVGGGGPRYKLQHPKTGKPCVIPDGGWMWVEDTMKERVANGLVLFGPDETTVPQQKIYLADTDTVVLNSVLEIPGKNGTQDLASLVPNADFPYPKPVALLQTIVELTTKGGDLILDPFVGSGTSAEAVLRLNALSEDEPERRFVCIEMDREIEKKITSVRLDRLIRGQPRRQGGASPGIGGSYSRWKLGKPFREGSGKLGGASRRALASALAAHHSRGAYELVDEDCLVARADGLQLFLFDGGVEFGAEELADVAAGLGKSERAVVYASRLLIDETEALHDKVTTLQLPYDLPIGAV